MFDSSVLLTDFIFEYHRLYITYWRHKLKQFQLNINHWRHCKAFKVLSKVHFTIYSTNKSVLLKLSPVVRLSFVSNDWRHLLPFFLLSCASRVPIEAFRLASDTRWYSLIKSELGKGSKNTKQQQQHRNTPSNVNNNTTTEFDRISAHNFCCCRVV